MRNFNKDLKGVFAKNNKGRIKLLYIYNNIKSVPKL